MVSMLLSASCHCIAFLLSWLPEDIKRKRFELFNRPSVHVVSGGIESMGALALLVDSFFRFMNKFTMMVAVQLSERYARDNVLESDLPGMGAIGFLSFLLRPLTLLCLALFVEGVIRGTSALLVQGTPGTFVLAVPYRLARFALRRMEARAHRSRFGPPVPDELATPECTRSGLLEVYCSREKPWHDSQVLEYGERLYKLDAMQCIQRGEHLAWRYCFREMKPGEIIRGSLVRFGIESPPSSSGCKHSDAVSV